MQGISKGPGGSLSHVKGSELIIPLDQIVQIVNEGARVSIFVGESINVRELVTASSHSKVNHPEGAAPRVTVSKSADPKGAISRNVPPEVASHSNFLPEVASRSKSASEVALHSNFTSKVTSIFAHRSEVAPNRAANSKLHHFGILRHYCCHTAGGPLAREGRDVMCKFIPLQEHI